MLAKSAKCFGVPPGLGVGSVSEEALKMSEVVKNKGWYFDFKLWQKYQKNAGTPVTSVIPQIAGLNKILHMISGWGGKEKFFSLYNERNIRIRDRMQKLGLTLFPKKDFESPTVNCIKAPKNLSGVEIYQKMRTKGFELAQGYGTIKDTTFRIGNMGYIEFEDIELMLRALEEILASLG